MAFLTVLVWPLTILIIAIVFRGELARTMGRLASFKYGEFEVGFNNELRKAEDEARRGAQASGSAPAGPKAGAVLQESARPEAAALGGGGLGDAGPLYRLAILKPRAAIREAWQRVEQALREAACEAGVADRAERLAWDSAARRLGEIGVISPELRARFDHLRILFDWAARGPELESPVFADHARRYIDLTLSAIAALRQGS